jgi:poly(A) polymerase
MRTGEVRPDRVPMVFDEARIDIDALKVVRRLTRHGFEAYLVGGGVRDLLLGCRPKDFDVATDARPEQVRRLFRNSRIIGRRFRLVHVVFGSQKVIEVATFRRSPENGAGDSDDGTDEPVMIRSDNLFGQAHEDAMRRDLTINALLYDVDRKQVLDFVGGVPDVRARVVRTIGDPRVRFVEDPVRMLRAIKFAARLDLGIEPEVYDAIVLCREAITSVARPRLLEEILKVLRCGASHRAFWLLWETGLLHVMLPELGTYLDDDPIGGDGVQRFWRSLTEVDHRTRARAKPLHDLTLMTVLLLEPMREVVDGSRDRALAALDFAEPVFARLAVPRRMADGICRIVAVMPKLTARKPARFARTEQYRLAMEVLSLSEAWQERCE